MSTQFFFHFHNGNPGKGRAKYSQHSQNCWINIEYLTYTFWKRWKAHCYEESPSLSNTLKLHAHLTFTNRRYTWNLRLYLELKCPFLVQSGYGLMEQKSQIPLLRIGSIWFGMRLNSNAVRVSTSRADTTGTILLVTQEINT